MSREGKVPCDSCGRREYERSLSMIKGVIDGEKKVYFVCQSCHGYYDEVELLLKCYEQE